MLLEIFRLFDNELEYGLRALIHYLHGDNEYLLLILNH